jgi:hypothetical protein
MGRLLYYWQRSLADIEGAIEPMYPSRPEEEPGTP